MAQVKELVVNWFLSEGEVKGAMSLMVQLVTE